MPKITLNPIGAQYGSIDALNDNFAAIEDAFENTLSRDGTQPNFMRADFDMNNYSILNAKGVYATDLYLDGVKVDIGDNYGLTVENIFQVNSFVATAGQTVFDVGVAIEFTNSVIVAVNGFVLAPGDFTVSGSQVVLNVASDEGDDVVIRRFTKRVEAPALVNYRFENETIFDTSFSISLGRNGMTAGPITILDNVIITIPTGSSWHIV